MAEPGFANAPGEKPKAKNYQKIQFEGIQKSIYVATKLLTNMIFNGL